MKVEVKNLPGCHVAYVRVIGELSKEKISPAFDKVIKWAEAWDLIRPETLLWDNWGLMTTDMDTLSEGDLELMDQVAVITQKDDSVFIEVRNIYNEYDELKVPKIVKVISPSGAEQEDTLLRGD